MSEYSKRRYWALKSMGRCVSCGREFEGEHTRCPECMKKVSAASVVSQRKRNNTLKAKDEIIRRQLERIKELENKDEGNIMRELLKIAQKKLDEACKGTEDVCSIRYYMGYAQAIRDVNKKLRLEGLEELEAGD